MCKAMEDMRNEAAKMKAVHIARLMLDGGKLSYEDITVFVFSLLGRQLKK